MQLYLAVWYLLAWSVTISLLSIVIFPWGILAYKIWHGAKPIDEELGEELLGRSWGAGWRLFLAAIAFTFLDYLVVAWLDLPPGWIHMLFYIGFLFYVSWVMAYCYSLEDQLQGLILAVIYLYIPTAILWLIPTRWNLPYSYVLSWLIQPE
jgi:hypothetical protein